LSDHQAAASIPPHYENVPADFAGSLKQLLKTYVQEGDLTIDFAAQLCNTSKRSLQRKLSDRHLYGILNPSELAAVPYVK
jgi:hypothetical protein